MGLTTPPCKKLHVTKTQRQTKLNPILGGSGVPNLGHMMSTGESRKEATRQMPPPPIKHSLRIGSWNARTLYEAGKCAQAAREMKRNRLHILGISETHWIQSGQKRLHSGELILFSGKDQGPHSEGVAFILNKEAQKTLW